MITVDKRQMLKRFHYDCFENGKKHAFNSLDQAGKKNQKVIKKNADFGVFLSISNLKRFCFSCRRIKTTLCSRRFRSYSALSIHKRPMPCAVSNKHFHGF